MDSDPIAKKFSSIGILKHKFIGSFPADMIAEILPPASVLSEHGTQQKTRFTLGNGSQEGGSIYFGDSLGNDPMFYRNTI